MKNTALFLSLALFSSFSLSAKEFLIDLISQSDCQKVKEALDAIDLTDEDKSVLVSFADDVLITNRKNLDHDWIKVYLDRKIVISALLSHYFLSCRSNVFEYRSLERVYGFFSLCINGKIKYLLYSTAALGSFAYLLKAILYDANNAYKNLHKKVDDAQKVKYLLQKS